MSSEWTFTTLGYICKAQGGSIQTGPFGSQLHTSDYKQSGTPVVMPTNIGDGGIFTEGIARIDEYDVERLSQHKFCLDDIVFSRRGDVTKNALIRKHEVDWLCGTGCLKVRLGNKSIANAKFISYCLRLPEIKDWLIRHAVGATMPNLNMGILSAVPIHLPPFHIQHEIAEILAALDDRIALLRETNTTLEAIAQALFKSWFVDFDPVHAKKQGREPEGMDADTAALFPDRFDESELGLVPSGWQLTFVKDVAEIIKGKSYSSKDLVDTHNTALVSLKSFERGGGFRLDGFKPYTGSYKPSQVVVSGDLIIAYTDVTQAAELIGKPAIVVGVVEYQTLVASLDVGILRPALEKVSRQFLYGLCKTDLFQSHTLAHTSGTTVLHLAKDGVGTFQFVLPPNELIASFTAIAESLSERKQINIDQIRNLIDLRDTLLPRLISGQLRLPEALDTNA
jgi:type I restriction enzyme S subunit